MNYAKFLGEELTKIAEKKGEPVKALMTGVVSGGEKKVEPQKKMQKTNFDDIEEFSPSFQAVMKRLASGEGEGVSDLSPEAKQSILRGLTFMSRPQAEQDIKAISENEDYKNAKMWLVQFGGMPQRHYFTDDVLRTGWIGK